MGKIEFCAPCLFGLEGVLAKELKDIEAENIRAENGRVLFSGDYNTLARANICLRTAERVCIVLGSFYAKTFDNLFEGTKRLPFERFIGKNNAFPVSGWSLDSRLFSVRDCQKIIKKAAVTRLSEKYKVSWFEETGSTVKIRFSILKDSVTIMLDTSGEPLHKRGYRAQSTIAPIKETLAAAMVMLSRPYSDSTLYDPFCGSGTILVESALIAAGIAPGLKRRFAAENWGSVKPIVFKNERIRARESINRGIEFKAVGSDIDENAVALTLENAEKAGVGEFITAKTSDISDFSPATERGIIVTNPPYGERLLDIDEARRLYGVCGRVFEKKHGYRYSVISPDEQFEQLFGRPADKRRKLYNGMLKCNLYMYFK